MAITRVGTFAAQSFVLTQINSNMAKYVENQEQVSTGQKSQRYSGIASQSAMSIDLSNGRDNIDQYQRTADTVNSRISAVHTSLSDVIDILTKFRAQLIQGMTADQADDARLANVADGYLQQVEGALNTDLGGVYLFGGTKSDAPPVDLSDPVDNQNGTYYSGSDQLMSARVDESTVVTYGATANRQGFKDLILALQTVKTSSANLDSLKTSLDKVNASLSDLTNLEAEVGQNMAVVESSKTHNDNLKSTLVNQLGSIQDVDISAAMVNLTQRQTILQASYSVIARASQLSLTNYL